jgi:hypothetical protein
VRRVPRRVVPLLFVVATAVICVTPPASAVDRPGYVAVTDAERRQLQPLAQAAVAAFRGGRLERLCSLQSLQAVRRVHGSLAHCRAALAQATHPCAGRCTYRVGTVLGLYETSRDEALGRKTVGWLYLVRGHPRFRGVSELELRFRKQGGRWTLTHLRAPDPARTGHTRAGFDAAGAVISATAQRREPRSSFLLLSPVGVPVRRPGPGWLASRRRALRSVVP